MTIDFLGGRSGRSSPRRARCPGRARDSAVVFAEVGESHGDAREENDKHEQNHTNREVWISCGTQVDRFLSSPSTPAATRSDQTILTEH